MGAEPVLRISLRLRLLSSIDQMIQEGTSKDSGATQPGSATHLLCDLQSHHPSLRFYLPIYKVGGASRLSWDQVSPCCAYMIPATGS